MPWLKFVTIVTRLRIFDSGVMVLQSRDHSEDKVIKNTAAIVS